MHARLHGDVECMGGHIVRAYECAREVVFREVECSYYLSKLVHTLYILCHSLILIVLPAPCLIIFAGDSESCCTPLGHC